MSARLPQTGGDEGKWGDILNEFLQVSHNSDGSLKPIDQSQVAGLSATLADTVITSDVRLSDERTPSDGSVTDAKVSSNAAISADKLADGTTKRVMTAAERTLLAGATNISTNDTLVKRDGVGTANFQRVYIAQQPATTLEATRKDYVDQNGASTAADNLAWTGTITLAGNTGWTTPSMHVRTLSGNTVISTLPDNPFSSRSLVTAIVLVQASSGGPYTVTWPGSLTWITGIVPSMPTAAGARLVVRLIWTGTEWLGSADEADLAHATSTSSNYTLVRRDGGGAAGFGRVALDNAPTNVWEATRKDYVDSYGSATNADAAAVSGTLDLSTAVFAPPKIRVLTLSGNVTVSNNPSSLGAGRGGVLALTFKQPATGGPFTVTWPTMVWANGAAAPTMPTAANAELEVYLNWNGTAWRAKVGGTYFP